MRQKSIWNAPIIGYNRVAENIRTIWTRSARIGNPGVGGLSEWAAWDSETDKYLLITDPLQIKNGCNDRPNRKPDTSRQAIFQLE